MGLSLLHFMTYMDEVVFMHLQEVKGFACDVSNPIMELVSTSCYEADLLSVQCREYVEGVISAVTVGKEIWELHAIS